MIYQDNETVAQALQKYYAQNALPSDGGVKDPWARYQLGPWKAIAFPNFSHRVRAIQRHDLHHLVNNLDTSSKGEGLIAAWELGSGCGKYWISWMMESQALWWGIFLAPQKTLSLFLMGRQSRNFFHEALSENLLNKSLGELREQLLPKAIKAARASDLFVFVLCALLGLSCMPLFFLLVSVFSILGPIIETMRPKSSH